MVHFSGKRCVYRAFERESFGGEPLELGRNEQLWGRYRNAHLIRVSAFDVAGIDRSHHVVVGLTARNAAICIGRCRINGRN
jgi:hypothetical protein